MREGFNSKTGEMCVGGEMCVEAEMGTRWE